MRIDHLKQSAGVKYFHLTLFAIGVIDEWRYSYSFLAHRQNFTGVTPDINPAERISAQNHEKHGPKALRQFINRTLIYFARRAWRIKQLGAVAKLSVFTGFE